MMRHSLFFAVWPDAVMRARLSEAAERALSNRDAQDGRRVDPSRYHLTLAYLGNHAQVSPQIIEPIVEAAESVRAHACTLILDRVGHFGADVGWLGASTCPDTLSALHAALHARLADMGFPAPTPTTPFVPHVTLLRRARTPLADAALKPAWPWCIDAFALVQGTLTSSVRYRVLRTFPLSERSRST
ncbi:RNA 2',3'-cyclic phosphodiesterase [Oleiagrimonas soli]|uniref:RNA 2',3'-cyclic phosphodiesterase n=1 Tax=Oleiagrimonas soli TaxID=1543381 RepID=A0A099CW81_9GAMM|nr:RNA 2',3'-cyclic phosphodiesterase [Oleiagrimonas soli]KGI78228.1 hypothetical protein LF63_0107810 [Oleiagrimonas soli]MBB6183308.1 2'-5' RNA ligase [Oleiagrimonas soli]